MCISCSYLHKKHLNKVKKNLFLEAHLATTNPFSVKNKNIFPLKIGFICGINLGIQIENYYRKPILYHQRICGRNNKILKQRERSEKYKYRIIPRLAIHPTQFKRSIFRKVKFIFRFLINVFGLVLKRYIKKIGETICLESFA